MNLIVTLALVLMLLPLSSQAENKDIRASVKKESKSLNILTNNFNYPELKNKVFNFINKNQTYLNENRFTFICKSNKCSSMTNRLKKDLQYSGKKGTDIVILKKKASFGGEFDFIFTIDSYKVLKPNCRKTSFYDSIYDADNSNELGCSSMYLELLSQKNIGKTINSELR